MSTGRVTLALAVLSFATSALAHANLNCDLNVQPKEQVVKQLRTGSSSADSWEGSGSATARDLAESCRQWIFDTDNVKEENRDLYTCENYQYESYWNSFLEETRLDFATMDIVYHPKMTMTEIVSAKCDRLTACMANATTIADATEIRKASEAFGCQ